MALSKEEILQATNGGLDVFRYFIPGDWRVGKKFLNPFYEDKKASCHVYFDIKSKTYKVKDFGEVGFAGDCFFLVGFLYQKNCSDKHEFIEILNLIDQSLGLMIGENSRPIARPNLPRKPLPPNEAKEEVEVEQLHALKFEVPKSKEFSETELAFWEQYGINISTLHQYNVCSLVEFVGISKEGKHYTLKSSDAEPIFAYLGKNYMKVYRPNSDLRFLYSGVKPEGYVFGLEQLPTRGDVLFITGGEKDVLSLASRGLPAICFNSETAKIPKNIIKRLSFRFKHVTLLYDVDKTGLEASLKHAETFAAYDMRRLLLPLSGAKSEKDISDFFRLGKSKDDLMRLFSEMLDKIYEETMSVLQSCEIDFDNPPVKPEPLITINEVTIGAPGNLLCITGSEGSGKTNYLGGIISGAISLDDQGIDTLGAQVKQNLDRKAVLFYDTEQSEDQLYKNLTFILKRSNLQKPPEWFKAYCMVGLSRKDRMQSILQSMDKFYYQFGGIHMVVIDGIADLIDGVNDEEKSVQLVEELFRLAGIYKTLIVVVLHLAPSGLKLRGHLGSEIQRKAAGILSVEKDDDNNSSVIKALKVRDGNPLEVPLVQFGWDKEKNHHVYLGEKSKDFQEQRKVDDLTDVAREIFGRKLSLTYQELVVALMDTLSVRDRQAKNYIKYMKDNKIIEKGGETGNELVLVDAPF
jgi:hypothetical protein